MHQKTKTYAISALRGTAVSIEADVAPGLPAFNILGAKPADNQNTRERIRCAIRNSDFEMPQRRITINCAGLPENRPLPTSADLPIAIAILQASGQLPVPESKIASLGELSLDGAIRPISGALACAQHSRTCNDDLLLVPRANLHESQLSGQACKSLASLQELPEVLADLEPDPVASLAPQEPATGPDLADLRGHATAIRALTIAAAGGHPILLIGPPGCARTMLARRLPSILPPMTKEEALAVTRIQSLAGILHQDQLTPRRPFRAPHHTVSAAALIGTANQRTPCELALANNGVLHLDQVNEYPTRTLEALSTPMAEGSIAFTQDETTTLVATDFQLVASADPCPCGSAQEDKCRCSAKECSRYHRRLQTPFFDRIDMRCHVMRPTSKEVENGPITTSAEVQALVVAARATQARRYSDTPFERNADLSATNTRRLISPPSEVSQLLTDAYASGKVSLRQYDRTLRVARTIADLDGHTQITKSHLLEALTYSNPLT